MGIKKILVTGGAGYIGSHTILALIRAGYAVVSIDNFSNSNENNFIAIEKLTGVSVQNVNADLADRNETDKAFAAIGEIDAIIHFAAYKYVGESSRDPLKYFNNNIKSLLNVIDAAKDLEIKNLVFSSSCTVYGNPEVLPVSEESPQLVAQSPYGRSKQICEQILQDCLNNGLDLNLVTLRYFNPAGIDSSGELRETTQKKQETLVPIIEEVFLEKREQLVVFGSDYDTRDGSALRDYIHISDLADAHLKAIEFLEKKSNQPINEVFNLGLGEGVTVLEMIQAGEKVFRRKLNYTIGDKRIGDASTIYSNINKAKTVLNWKPKNNIEDIFKSLTL